MGSKDEPLPQRMRLDELASAVRGAKRPNAIIMRFCDQVRPGMTPRRDIRTPRSIDILPPLPAGGPHAALADALSLKSANPSGDV